MKPKVTARVKACAISSEYVRLRSAEAPASTVSLSARRRLQRHGGERGRRPDERSVDQRRCGALEPRILIIALAIAKTRLAGQHLRDIEGNAGLAGIARGVTLVAERIGLAVVEPDVVAELDPRRHRFAEAVARSAT